MTLRPARALGIAIAGLLVALGVAGCGSMSGGAVSYAPAAYGQQIGSVYDCYYVTTPTEVTDLISAGLCPVRSVATPMPLSWEEEYFSYYSSPAYYDTYMPVSYRSRYTSVTIVHFRTTHSKQISTMSSKAVYKSSSGGTVSGGKVNTKQFGSGTRSGTTYGSGTRNGGTTSKSGTTTGSRSGTLSGSRSGSYGGGSRH